MRITTVKAAVKQTRERCLECHQVIEPGQGYRWIKFRYGGRRVLHTTCRTFKSSEMTNNPKLSTIYEAVDQAEVSPNKSPGLRSRGSCRWVLPGGWKISSTELRHRAKHEPVGSVDRERETLLDQDRHLVVREVVGVLVTNSDARRRAVEQLRPGLVGTNECLTESH